LIRKGGDSSDKSDRRKISLSLTFVIEYRSTARKRKRERERERERRGEKDYKMSLFAILLNCAKYKLII